MGIFSNKNQATPSWPQQIQGTRGVPGGLLQPPGCCAGVVSFGKAYPFLKGVENNQWLVGEVALG